MGGGEADQKPKRNLTDVDLDIRLGAIAGHNGEALRGVELKMTRRAGQIRSFTLNSKIGRDTPLTGDLRGAARGRNVLYFETVDAGALFRFTDTYPKMTGGQMWVAMDPPGPDQAPQEGILNVRDFTIRGEPGTFVPLYGINNAFGQLPIVGLFLGGSNEGLVGITYEVVGPPGAPVLRVNPISAVAPGMLRKFFEFPGAGARDAQDAAPPPVRPAEIR
jgi:hypothetical protein